MTGEVAWVKARTAAEAVALRRALGPSARFAAGATALQLAWPGGSPDHPVVDISGLTGPGPMGPAPAALVEGRLRLAAAASLEDLRKDAALTAHAPALAAAIGAIGAIGVRTLATLGGNLAWRAGDLVPLLLVLDAVVISFEHGARPIAAWLAAPDDDLVLAVDLPLPVPAAILFEKVAARAAFAPSLVTVATALTRDGPVAAVGGGPVAPARLAWGDGERQALAAGRLALADRLAPAIAAPDDEAASGRHRALAAANLIAGHLAGWSEP